MIRANRVIPNVSEGSGGRAGAKHTPIDLVFLPQTKRKTRR
jgi:hypothetical protein